MTITISSVILFLALVSMFCATVGAKQHPNWNYWFGGWFLLAVYYFVTIAFK